jgi:hypothetical protein
MILKEVTSVPKLYAVSPAENRNPSIPSTISNPFSTVRPARGKAAFGPVVLIAALLFAVLASVPALAQSEDTAKAVDGQTPRPVLDGTATRISHYSLEQKLRVVLALRRPHVAEEEKFLEELQTKGSPNFHKFLSGEEWNARFSPSVED